MFPSCNLNKKLCCKKCVYYGVCYRSCLFQTITCDVCDYKIIKDNEGEEKMRQIETIVTDGKNMSKITTTTRDIRIDVEKVDISDDIIAFAGMNESVIIPSKKAENAGFDVYANFEEDYIVINPHVTKMIPTGLISACNPKYYFQLFERGSTGTKGMAQRCGVIDSGYRGEWFVPITNTTEVPIVIIKKEALDRHYEMLSATIMYPYEKAICQAVLIEVPKVKVKTLTVEEIKNISSERGEGRIGSSGK